MFRSPWLYGSDSDFAPKELGGDAQPPMPAPALAPGQADVEGSGSIAPLPGEIVADSMDNDPHGQALGPGNIAEESKDDIRDVNSKDKSDVKSGKSDGNSEDKSEDKSDGNSDQSSSDGNASQRSGDGSDGNSDQSSGDGNLSQRSGDGKVTSASAKGKTKPVVKTEPVMSINRQYHFDESLAEHTYTHTHIHTYTYTEKGGGSRKS